MAMIGIWFKVKVHDCSVYYMQSFQLIELDDSEGIVFYDWGCGHVSEQ